MPIRVRASLAAGMALVMANRAALRFGLLPRVDGWRRAAALVLRGEESTFVLSAFGLDGGSAGEGQLAARLRGFLETEPLVRVGIQSGVEEDRIVACDGPRYSIRIEQCPSGPARFVRPDDWSGDSVPQSPDAAEVRGLMSIVCRADPSGRTDVWVRVNHVGADGVPVQSMLSRLEKAWGVKELVVFPTPDQFRALEVPRVIGGRAGLGEIQAFLDFGPLLAWRKAQNARLDQPMTISAAMLWCLGRHVAFRPLHMGTTVEVAPTGGLSSGVGVVVVRPGDHVRGPDRLARYVLEFNRQVERTRNRASEGCRMLDAAAHLSPRRAKSLLRFALDQGTRAFGSLGLTMLREAQVFGAPIGETGHEHGFFAVGDVGLPTDSGGRVGCVVVKGPRHRIGDSPRILREAIAHCGD